MDDPDAHATLPHPDGLHSKKFKNAYFCLKVRLLDGSTITTVFKALEPLAAVRVYVQMNSNVPEGQDFTLLSPYPRHVYTEQDMEKPLKELGEHQTQVFSVRAALSDPR